MNKKLILLIGVVLTMNLSTSYAGNCNCLWGGANNKTLSITNCDDKTKVQEYAAKVENISGDKFIFDAVDHKECFRTKTNDDDGNEISYYHTGTACAELPERGNITCTSGYANYN